jgi:hypothetical protein
MTRFRIELLWRNSKLNKLRYIVDTSQVLESWKDLDRIKGNWEENESKIHP